MEAPVRRKSREPLSQDEAARQEEKGAKREAFGELVTSIAEFIEGILGLLGHG